MHPDLPYWLASLYLPGVGSRTMRRWLSIVPSIKYLFTASSAELEASGLSAKDQQALASVDWKRVERDIKWAEQPNHQVMTIEDIDYPLLLKEIPDPPLVLYLKGHRRALAHQQLAMVGSRHPTPTGAQNAEQFAHYLAISGFAITSGLALGIDAASHRGALSAKGITIGVAGTGLYHTYPAAHNVLVEQIMAENGAVISEFPLMTAPQPYLFPRRNRIIAGLSLGVLVVEAALKSGSLITARLAIDQGREVFAIPGSIHNALARGCHYLIRQGAKLVETASDVIEELGALSALNPIFPPSQVAANDLSSDCVLLLAQVGYEITPLDVILLRSGLTAREVSSMLLTLELSGYIQSVPGGYVRVTINEKVS